MIVLKQFSRIVITAIIAVGYLQLSGYGQEGYWLVLSALLMISVQIEKSFLKSQLFLIIWGCVLAGHVALASYLSASVGMVGLYLSVIAFLSVAIGLFNANYFYPAWVVNILGILSAGMPVAYDLRIERCEFILFGLLIAVVIRSVIWPETIRLTFKTLHKECLIGIKALQQKIFLMYLKRDYQDNHYGYEKQLHQSHFSVLDSINRMRQLSVQCSLLKKKHYDEVINQLDGLVERVDALGNLRYRINDLATLEVCENELRGVADVLTDAFDQAIYDKQSPIDHDRISALDDIFRTTLQVISNEPVVVLIFINNIKKILLALNVIAKEDRGL